MIEITVHNDEKVIKRLWTIPKTVHDSLLMTITRLSVDLQRYVVKNKLSGQVLKRRTGTLAASIHWRVVDDKKGIIGIVGSRVNEAHPLKYAAVHEYGFHGPVTVKEHVRMQTMAWGKPITPVQVTVRQHIMNMNMPERSFLRSSLRENRANIEEKIKKALSEGLKK